MRAAGTPAALSRRRPGRALTACEIKATVSRRRAPAPLAGRAAVVPPGVRFAVTAHRGPTHGRSWPPGAGDTAGLLDRRRESRATRGGRRGAVRVPFPPSRRRDAEGRAARLAARPAESPAALEFRRARWSDAEVAARVAAAGATICQPDTSGAVPDRLPPGARSYVRLRADRCSPAEWEG